MLCYYAMLLSYLIPSYPIVFYTGLSYNTILSYYTILYCTILIYIADCSVTFIIKVAVLQNSEGIIESDSCL